jgi:hypothetical protein
VSDPDDGDYKVGKGRPPKHTQFKKNVVNNPFGRAGKKGLKLKSRDRSIQAIFRAVADDKVTVNQDGVPRKMTRLELAVWQLFYRAAKGEPGALREIRLLMATFPDMSTPPIQIKGFELEVVPSPYDGLSSEEAEARALVDLEKWWGKKSAS